MARVTREDGVAFVLERVGVAQPRAPIWLPTGESAKVYGPNFDHEMMNLYRIIFNTISGPNRIHFCKIESVHLFTNAKPFQVVEAFKAARALGVPVVAGAPSAFEQWQAHGWKVMRSHHFENGIRGADAEDQI